MVMCFSCRILSHASEILSQSVNMALSLCEVDIVSKASAEMVECTAQYDADIASSFLLLHQVIPEQRFEM